MPPLTHLILYCRAGFENECAAEIADVAAAMGVFGFCKAKPDSGYVQFVPHEPQQARALSGIPVDRLVFARQAVCVSEFLTQLPVHDRLQALLPAIERMGQRYADLRLETADTNDAKALNTFCRKFAGPLRHALEKKSIAVSNHADPAEAPNLHLFFLSSSAVHIGWSDPASASPWVMGIPRLKFPSGAPSRSTLKLEEAFFCFFSEAQRTAKLRAGMSAVDLGAAPGGWTWQLVKRGMHVTAVDNGPMDATLMASGLVEHLRVDGFRYRPAKTVDWLVCDIVEQPARIAALVGRWLAQNDCRNAIFNLKLPMKKRYEAVQQCGDIIQATLTGSAMAERPRFKQLYHDREEVTGYLSV
ncbi:MAG: 23S rRNA (cytidine(2498)-2'-O)-methyltransferase RlmM [Methylococcaceae bacterium]|nr:MAG: 23S rRNA (cytidine(2498)-2'-O)-methyltransferase RlmM [Methylococcaceae bacterium]